MLAALASAANSPLDEVIQLCHASKPMPKEVLPSVRPVVYRTTEDVLSLLGATHVAKLSYLESNSKAVGTKMATSSDTTFEREAESDGKRQAAGTEYPDNEDDEESEDDVILVGQAEGLSALASGHEAREGCGKTLARLALLLLAPTTTS